MKKFDTPAYQGNQDFKSFPSKLALFENSWSNYVKYCNLNSQMGNPWSSSYDHPRSWYYNPLITPVIPTIENTVPIQWGAFPNRINHYFSTLFIQEFGKDEVDDKLHELADIGPDAFKIKYGITLEVPKYPCNPSNTETKPFGPSGPRGWQDEYCEWAVTRDNNRDIITVHFTHENPEYWYHLWKTSPDLVTSLYREILNNDTVKKEDLYLLDANGKPTIVRETGLPAYNPINKWNNGSEMSATGGGAVHLTSPPNSLGAEIYLGAAATILREVNGKIITDANQLICASQYGQIYRNSDPRIGQNVNFLVNKKGLQVSLTNPIALYGQIPDFSLFQLPPNANFKIEDCYTVTRGLLDNTGDTYYPNNMILHSKFSVPEGANFKLSDILVSGKPLKWGSQLADTFKVQLAGTGIVPLAGQKPEIFPPVGDSDTVLPSVQYLLDYNLLVASLYNKLNTFSNLTSCITQVEAASITTGIAVLTNGATKDTNFDFGSGIAIKKEAFRDLGNDTQLFIISIKVDMRTTLGEKPMVLFNNTSDLKYPLSGVLEVVGVGTLPRTTILPKKMELSPVQVNQILTILK